MLNEGMAPQIFNLSIKWKCTVSIIPWSSDGEHPVLPVEYIKSKPSFFYQKQPLKNKGKSGCIFHIFAGHVIPGERFLQSHWIEGYMGSTGSLGPGKMRKTCWPC
jgi:hypothetical protein